LKVQNSPELGGLGGEFIPSFSNAISSLLRTQDYIKSTFAEDLLNSYLRLSSSLAPGLEPFELITGLEHSDEKYNFMDDR
jgi:hypothetical protein